MKKTVIRAIGLGTLLLLWLTLAAFAWFSPSKESSAAERRLLAQWPELSEKTLADGSFMSDFETYTQDQFPLRDVFRSVKAMFHYYALGQKENNDLILSGGYIAQVSDGVDTGALQSATELFQKYYDRLIAGKAAGVYVSIVPEKAYYLNCPKIDFAALYSQVLTQMDWAVYTDITDLLTLESYYRTDQHWKQESLVPVADRLLRSMNSESNGVEAGEFTVNTLETPFYGTYYAQAAVPLLKPDTLRYLQSDRLADCTVTGLDPKGSFAPIDMYNMGEPEDPYDLFLSGSTQSLVTVENPNAETDRHLVIFRDSFGCSLAPLLAGDYARITLLDIRDLTPQAVAAVDFQDADVLFLFSTLVLNNPDSFS